MASLPLETTFGELKRYVRFTDHDAQLLAAVGPRIAAAFPRIAQELYERSREHDEAHAVFTGEEQIARLQSSLVTWLERVFGGTYDAAYFAEAEAVSRMHTRIGLPQRYVIAGMRVVRDALAIELDACLGAKEARATESALGRLLDVELTVMLEIYRGELLGRLDRSSNITACADETSKLDAAPVLFVEIDPAGNIAFFNRAAEQVTGWPRDEVLGRPFLDLVVASSSQAALFAAELGRDGIAEAPLETRAGKVLRVRWRSSKTGAGSTFAVGGDVTTEIADRDRFDREARLTAAGTLVAGLAHELRNPLNGAGLHLAVVERALAGGVTGEARDAARVIGTELRRLGDVITELLDFARPKTLAPVPLSAQQLCGRALATVRAAAEAAKVTLASDLPAHELVFEADGESLEHVLVHLLENAIEAVGPKGGNVIVRARREPHHVWIEVEDDGPGLSDKDAPIFDPFYSTKPSGTGLGLAVVHRLVSDHDGHVDVDSRPGCTRFRLRLPLHQEGMTT